MATLLPGQTKNASGVSNYILGTNSPDPGSEQDFITNTNVQQQQRTAGVSVIRFSSEINGSGGIGGTNWTHAQMDAMATACANAGCQPLVILNVSNLSFNQDMVAYLGNRCNLYEFGNEPDIPPTNLDVATYSTRWNMHIPALRLINPNAAFIGPALAAWGNTTYLSTWLNNVKSVAGAAPDGVSVHIYPCTSNSLLSPSVCLNGNGSDIIGAGNIGGYISGVVRPVIQTALGYSVPLCITEWNADAWYSGSSGVQQTYADRQQVNEPFNYQFAVNAIDSFATHSIDMACEFKLTNWLMDNGSGTYAMCHYRAFVDENKKYFTKATTMGSLPGQTKTASGASNYIFGTNTPNYNTTLSTSTNIQNQMKSAGITVIRAGFSDSVGNLYSDAQMDAQYTAIHNAGAVILGILPHNQSAFAQHVVSYMGSRCLMYEYSNEPDISNGFTLQSYTNEWNQVIPLLRKANSNAAFIGPVLGVFSNAGNWITSSNGWLAQVAKAGNAPDAISVHIYPCTGGSIAEQTCISRASGIGASVASLRPGIKAILGYNPPMCLTEWNADAYYATAPPKGQGYNSNSASNDAFNNTFAVDVLEGLVANGIDMANHFELEYFLANPNGPTSSTAQFKAFQSETAKYLGSGGGSPPPSVGTISATPSTLAVTTPVNGGGTPNTVVIKNTGTASGTFSVPVTYSAYGNENWVSVQAASTTLAAGASTNVTVGCAPPSDMPAGVYTARINFTMGTSVSTVTLTMTVTSVATATSHLYVPAYAYPTDPSGTGSTWAQYEGGSPAVSFIIANPNSGPGSAVNSDFTTGIANMHAAGVKVLGYVNTSNHTALVASATVKSQIDSWYTWYPTIDGIHFDTVLPTSSNYSYYQDLYTYVQGKNTSVHQYVFLNPSQVPPESYMSACDAVCVYEGDYGKQIVTQAYMANYPAAKFAATVTNVTTTAQVDTTMSALQKANVGLAYITDQPTSSASTVYKTPPSTAIWNEAIKDCNVGSGGTSTGGGGSTGGGTSTPTALSVYLSSTIDATNTTSNDLYTTAGTPATTYSYTRVGTTTGYGELTAQTTTSAWAAVASLPAPTGKGFLLNNTSLEGQTIPAGSWAGVLRLNCAQGGDASPQQGTLTADIIVRAYKVNLHGSTNPTNWTFTPIVAMTLGAQSVTYAFANFTLPSTSASSMAFGTGDKLYIDRWLNVTGNANASSVQDVRSNHLSTDTTTYTGDPNSTIGTPGYVATSGGSTSTASATDTFTRGNQSGFGTASDGEAWTFTGTGTSSINNNTGVIVSTSSDTYAQLGTNTLADCDIRCDITLSNSGDNAGVAGRYSVSSGTVNGYKLSYNPGVGIALKKIIAGTNTTLTSATFTQTAGTAYTYHLRVQGSTISGNIYPTGTTEPSTFMVTTTDTSITGAGGFALRSNTASGSTGIAFDNFSASTIATSGTGGGGGGTGTPSPLTASPTSLAFVSTQGGGATAAQNVTLTTNASTSGTWAYSATYDKGYGWLSTNTSGGTLASSSSQTLAITANPQGLAPGTYTASIALTLSTASQTVTVTYVVSATGANTLPVKFTSAGCDLMSDALAGLDNSLIRYFAVGTGSTAPSVNDTQLVSEVMRKPITSFVDGSNNAEILVNCYLASSDVVGLNITEIGLFGGNAATSTAGSGVLVARGLYTLTNKNSQQGAQIVLDLQVVSQ